MMVGRQEEPFRDLCRRALSRPETLTEADRQRLGPEVINYMVHKLGEEIDATDRELRIARRRDAFRRGAR